MAPRIPSRVPCAGASCSAQPSPAQPAASRALPLHPPSLHLLFPPRDTHRAGGERDEENTHFGVPALTRSVVRVSGMGIAQPRSTFLGCSDGVSEGHPQKHRAVKLSVAGKGCSSPRLSTRLLPSWESQGFSFAGSRAASPRAQVCSGAADDPCASRAAEPASPPRLAAACEHPARSLRRGICRQSTCCRPAAGLPEVLLQRGRCHAGLFGWCCCSPNSPEKQRGFFTLALVPPARRLHRQLSISRSLRKNAAWL